MYTYKKELTVVCSSLIKRNIVFNTEKLTRKKHAKRKAKKSYKYS